MNKYLNVLTKLFTQCRTQGALCIWAHVRLAAPFEMSRACAAVTEVAIRIVS